MSDEPVRGRVIGYFEADAEDLGRRREATSDDRPMDADEIQRYIDDEGYRRDGKGEIVPTADYPLVFRNSPETGLLATFQNAGAGLETVYLGGKCPKYGRMKAGGADEQCQCLPIDRLIWGCKA